MIIMLQFLLIALSLFSSFTMSYAQEAEEDTALVFVPEYNIIDCEAILKKRPCRREREACIWIVSDNACKKRDTPIESNPDYGL